MIRSLRKGHSSIYIQHPSTGHSIGAKEYESEIAEDKAILRLTLSPVDSNQRSDEEHFHSDQLVSVSIDDSSVIKGFGEHVTSHKQKFSSWQLEVISRGKKFYFSVEPELEEHGNHGQLNLHVIPSNG
ncbi:hypothetical protein [Atopomonas hussainii]|uniref:hypothetical protein n=1 Tax=Atopomonas hussainii TaxID=1429083 RepID=UPI0009001F3A|nr:hypothetical protein [Atopomonas hussainii]